MHGLTMVGLSGCNSLGFFLSQLLGSEGLCKSYGNSCNLCTKSWIDVSVFQQPFFWGCSWAYIWSPCITMPTSIIHLPFAPLFRGARQATSDSNPLPVISALMIIAGLFRVFYSLYRFVTLLSGKVLESAESMILESLLGKKGRGGKMNND